jgi:hypothetical protein
MAASARGSVTFLELLSALVSNTGYSNPPVPLKLCSDLDSLVAPEISANVPVESVSQCALVQRLDVEPIRDEPKSAWIFR